MITQQLVDIADYGIWGNQWHSLAEAFRGLTEADLGYCPVEGLGEGGGLEQRFMPIGSLISHTAECTDDAARAIGAPCGEEPGPTLSSLEDAFRRFVGQARTLPDDRLPEPTGLREPEGSLGTIYLLVELGILHPAWHFGAAAEALAWREARDNGHQPPAPPSAPTAAVLLRDEQPWAVPLPSSRTEALVQLTERAHRASPWHSMRRVLDGATTDELAWEPLPDRCSVAHHAFHVAACKVIYADQAFGTAELGWGDVDRVLGVPRRGRTLESLLEVLDGAQGFLADHIRRVPEELLDRVNPMHHGVPHTGWQVVASMVEHDAWHGSQVALLRDAYAALWKCRGES